MSELFGAPNGIIAANELSNKNLITGLSAQKLMGDIEQQPAELAYKQAQVREMTAQADAREDANTASAAMAQLDQRFAQEWRAQQTLSGEAAKAGDTATVADLVGGSASATIAPDALYKRTLARLKWMEDQGVPESVLAGERDKLSKGLQSQAITGYRQAQTGEIQYKEKKAKLERIGGIAQAAASGPEQYAQAMLDPETAALLPEGMRLLSYEQARPHLQHIAQSAMTTVQQLAQKNADQVAADRQARNASSAAKDAATASAARVRAALTQDYRDTLAKNGGERSPSTAKANESLVEARDQKAALEFRKAYPAAPLEPSLWEVGKNYSNADGSKVAQYIGVGADGQHKWVPISVPTPRALRKEAAMRGAVSAINLPDPDDSLDDEDLGE